MMNSKNKIGQQFGNLIVDSINKEKTTNKHTYYNCHCLCFSYELILDFYNRNAGG